MSFRYFAYGSNLWPAQIRSRCPTAAVLGLATMSGWSAVYDKPGADGTAKLNLREADGSDVHGVVYEIDDVERSALDLAEPGYTPFVLDATLASGEVVEALTYRWEPEGTAGAPVDWYVAMVDAGAVYHGLDDAYIAQRLRVGVRPDTVASGVVPASAEDLPAMQEVLSKCLSVDTPSLRSSPG